MMNTTISIANSNVNSSSNLNCVAAVYIVLLGIIFILFILYLYLIWIPNRFNKCDNNNDKIINKGD